MTKIATITAPGLQTTVQDLGRPHYRHLGVPLCGAADRRSLRLANAALGNPESAAALECTLTGPALRFARACAFALCGADMAASLNDAPVAMGRAVEAAPGDVLSLGRAKSGARAYLAFAGGLAGERVFASASTYLASGFGGVVGRALRAGDEIMSAGLATTAPLAAADFLTPRLASSYVLRAMPGPEAERLGGAIASRFFSEPFTVTRDASRMGLRLASAPAPLAHREAVASSAVFPGTVQLPQGGAPILLLADAQTTGGYPRLAQIAEADLDLAGQLRPGDAVWFRRVSAEEARAALSERRAMEKACGLAPS